jgi:hypothetical protein
MNGKEGELPGDTPPYTKTVAIEGFLEIYISAPDKTTLHGHAFKPRTSMTSLTTKAHSCARVR